MQYKPGKDFALQMDDADPLRSFQKEFYIAEPDTIYLDGNSLGRLPLASRELIQNQTDFQWGERLIRSWNEGWYELSAKLGSKIAKTIGAKEDEVITCDSTSLNLYKLAYAAIKSQKGRTKIISDELNFPTDLYILQGILNQFGTAYELELVKSLDSQTIDAKTLADAIDENTALVVLSHVAFKSAFMYDMKKVNRLAHQKGALVLWDLSHSAGIYPINLNESGSDLAIGCTYKYLNGGPGSPAYLYVKSELQEHLDSPVWGWFGDHDPFSFKLDFKAVQGIKKFLVGTPPVLSMGAIEPGLDILLDAGLENIREKSVLQSDYLIFLFHQLLEPHGFLLGSPAVSAHRGSHISIQHPEAYRICKALINPPDKTYKVIPDFREPDNIRIGIAPLYNSFSDIFLAVDRINKIMTEKIFLKISPDRESVT
ncbi:kynureninase [Desulfosarcina sp.]|nr:kynureninase [Desulfosarcina sp.]